MLRLAVNIYFKNQTEFKLQQIPVLMLIYNHISKFVSAKEFLQAPPPCVLLIQKRLPSGFS